MDSTQELKTKLSNLKLQLKSRYPISAMAMFGSYAWNEQTKNSDVDILVELDGRIGIKFIDLANELEKALGLKVDLVSKKGIKDRYFKAIWFDLCLKKMALYWLQTCWSLPKKFNFNIIIALLFTMPNTTIKIPTYIRLIEYL